MMIENIKNPKKELEFIIIEYYRKPEIVVDTSIRFQVREDNAQINFSTPMICLNTYEAHSFISS